MSPTTAPEHAAGPVEVRCDWAREDPLLQAYHDQEWGVPTTDSRALWEMLMLEGFQAGLSWLTILRKREAFREAFAGFAPEKVARFGATHVAKLMENPCIVRSRAKIDATILGARIYCDMQDKGESFSDFAWSFTRGKVIQLHGERPTQTPLSMEVSRELKRRGFKFVGPTIAFAWLQSAGIVNGHTAHCFRRDQVGKPQRPA